MVRQLVLTVTKRRQWVGVNRRGLQSVMLILALLTVVLTAPVTQIEAKGLANGQFDYPAGIATDATGDVYVADSGNNRIQKFTSSGAFIAKWGREGSGNGQFVRPPSGIATNPAGQVYVTETTDQQRGRAGNRIQKFTSNGAFITKWGNGGSGKGQFDWPSGIATDAAGNVYVTNSNVVASIDGNYNVQKFTSSGAFVAKWGSTGRGAGQFEAPSGIATDVAGNVYVADSGNNRIQKFTVEGSLITQWGGKGSANGQFEFPNGIATDVAGNVYVADSGNNRIQKFTSDGTFVAKWGSGPRSHSGHKRKPVIIPTTRRKATFRAACRLARRCKARVTVKAGKKTLARGRYSIRAHSSRRVAIGLTAAGRKALARKRRVQAKLTIVDTRTHKSETIPVVLTR
jgi:phosphohistidine swiveling domain-containing protein